MAPRVALSVLEQEEDLFLLDTFPIAEVHTLSLHDALPIFGSRAAFLGGRRARSVLAARDDRVLLRRNRAAKILTDVNAPLVAPTVLDWERLDVGRREVGREIVEARILPRQAARACGVVLVQ